jgi:hypothetical protein
MHTRHWYLGLFHFDQLEHLYSVQLHLDLSFTLAELPYLWFAKWVADTPSEMGMILESTQTEKQVVFYPPLLSTSIKMACTAAVRFLLVI